MINKILIILFSLLTAFFLYSWAKVEITVTEVPKLEDRSRIVAQGFLPAKTQEEVGAGSGVEIDSKGNIFFLHRAGYNFNNNELIESDVVSVFSPITHKVIHTWGENIFKSPHGITIDEQDRVWITDIVLNKVYQFDLKGELLKTLGEDYPFYLEICLRIRNVLRHLPCSPGKYIFARPTDVEIYPDGSFVVSDGYRNSRIVKFDGDGKFQWEVSKFGNKDGEFHLPHGLAKDANGNIYVADRRNARIQVYSQDGIWKTTWDLPELGRPYGLDVGKDDFLYVVDAGDAYDISKGNARSQIIKLTLDGEVIDRYSGFGRTLGKIDLPHDIVVGEQGRIYVAEINNRRIQFFDQK